MRKLFLLVFLIFTFYLSFGQTSITGKWKLVKATLINYWNNKARKIVYEKDNKIHTRNSLNTNNDSVELVLKIDSTFYAASFGLIIPKAEPGWIFGDKISGKWILLNNKFLTLIISDEKLSHQFYYRIDKLLPNSLSMSFTDDNFKIPFLIFQFTR